MEHFVTFTEFGVFYNVSQVSLTLRILDIDDPKIVKKLTFLAY